jgi:hypothetical protein
METCSGRWGPGRQLLQRAVLRLEWTGVWQCMILDLGCRVKGVIWEVLQDSSYQTLDRPVPGVIGFCHEPDDMYVDASFQH